VEKLFKVVRIFKVLEKIFKIFRMGMKTCQPNFWKTYSKYLGWSLNIFFKILKNFSSRKWKIPILNPLNIFFLNFERLLHILKKINGILVGRLGGLIDRA